MAAHLSSNPRAILVSSPEIVDRVRGVAPALAASRLRAVLPPPGQSQRVDIAGTPVRVLRIRHNPSRRLPEQHLGFLIGDSAPVLHVGDADPAADNFAVLRSLPPIDLAFLPFWYVNNDANRRLVADAIRPKRIVAMHVPPKDAPTIAAALREANVGAQFSRSCLDRAGSRRTDSGSASCLSTTAGSRRIAWTAGPMAAASATAAMSPATRTIVDQSVGAIPYS